MTRIDWEHVDKVRAAVWLCVMGWCAWCVGAGIGFMLKEIIG